MKRLLALVTALFVAGLAFAVSAGAHVTVTAPGATRGGGDQEITFRVPVEKDSATTGVTVVLPTDTPIASVDVAPVPGWTHTQKSTKLAKPIKTDDGNITEAVTQITWTAQKGQGLKPGEYGDFTFIAGQLPDVAELSFGAIQTYSDGSVVKWIQRAAPGSTEEPDFPAPTLSLVTTSADPKPAVVQKASTTAPTVLAILALVVAAAALGLAVVGNARRKAAVR
jgi:uncharacterized protein